MEGLGSSGRLVGSISTYTGTYSCPWSVVMAKNPGGDFCLLSTVCFVYSPTAVLIGVLMEKIVKRHVAAIPGAGSKKGSARQKSILAAGSSSKVPLLQISSVHTEAVSFLWAGEGAREIKSIAVT